MLVFWIATALMCAAAAGLVLRRGSAAKATDLELEDPSLALYRRQLREVDDLAERGLIAPEDLRSAQTEAARRLISAADSSETWNPGVGGRRMVLAVALVTPLLALGLYVLIGSPGTQDQPYRARVAAWTKADPTTLDAAQMGAVLQTIVGQRPNEVDPLVYLARVQADNGDSFSAERNLQKALRLAPGRADLWSFYGELVAEDSGADILPDDAKAAFEKALSLDPKAAQPRYMLARSRIASGDVDAGLAAWRALESELNPAAPQHQALAQQIAEVERTHSLPVSTPPATGAGGGDQQAFIHRMVDSLAARLASHPDDPAGWARLVRSYSVLGDTARRDAALAKAQSLFKSRPQDLAAIEAAVSARP